MDIKFFRAIGKPLTKWGDYGDILQHGMTAHSPRVEGRLSLERTGPYIQPITFPGVGDIVLTSDARQRLESSKLTGFSFIPVEKAHIVELHWENWDLAADEPAQYPDSGEPEDYILGLPHSTRAAIEIGELWEIVVQQTVQIVSDKIERSTWRGDDLFKSSWYVMLFSQRAREWFSGQWGEFLEFVEFPSR